MHCGRSISKLINGQEIGPVCAEHLGVARRIAVKDELTIDWIEENETKNNESPNMGKAADLRN